MARRSVAVFCGSKTGVDPMFLQHAIELGTLLADASIGLIYGGGNLGLMGSIADSVMAAGGTVHGVIPEVLVSWERQHKGITELFVVNDMHVRKKKMYDLCDAAIILPGGFGTLDELFEMVTWNQLSIHDKQIYLLNSGGFYDHLVAHIARMKEQQFLYDAATERLQVASTPKELMQLLTGAVPGTTRY